MDGVPSPGTGGEGSGIGGRFVDMRPTQHSNICRRTAMVDTQILEHFVGSGLDNENRLVWRVPHVCELCLSTVAVDHCRRESRSVAVESFRKNVTRKMSTLAFCFCYFFLVLFSRYLGLNLQFFAKNESLFVLFRFFLPSLRPALIIKNTKIRNKITSPNHAQPRNSEEARP